jgi:acetyl esterase/lipase
LPFKFIKLAFITIALLFTTACNRVGLFVINFPTYFASHYTYHKNIAYGSQPWQMLDVYMPKKVKNAPVITFYYGGAWTSGAKEKYKFVADMLTKHGYVVVIPDYVKYPHKKYPAYQIDAALSTKWIVQNIHNYAGNADNMHFIGHSAGAHIGIMLIADRHYLQDQGLLPTIYKSFVGLSGPYHFTPKEPKYQEIFSEIDTYKKMQASHFIQGTEPPMLLIHGNADQLVGSINIDLLTLAIKEKNGHYMVKTYDDVDHIDTVLTFSSLLKRNENIKNDVLVFLNKTQERLVNKASHD